MSVDFPEPFSPRSPWISPGSRSRSSASSAGTPPKVFVTPRTATAAFDRTRPRWAAAPPGALIPRTSARLPQGGVALHVGLAVALRDVRRRPELADVVLCERADRGVLRHRGLPGHD